MKCMSRCARACAFPGAVGCAREHSARSSSSPPIVETIASRAAYAQGTGTARLRRPWFAACKRRLPRRRAPVVSDRSFRIARQRDARARPALPGSQAFASNSHDCAASTAVVTRGRADA